MMRGFWVGCVLLCASTALAIPPSGVPNPRSRDSWVADMADIIDAPTEARLDELITEAEAASGVEIAVVTVDSVSTPTPKDFATELFNLWQVGKAGEDNGLLVLMVVSERRLEMETGYGLEADLTDGWLQSMQQRLMVPSFRAGNYGTGLERGVAASIRRLGGGAAVPDNEVAALLQDMQNEGNEPEADRLTELLEEIEEGNEALPDLPPGLFGPPPTSTQEPLPAMSAPPPPSSSTPWGWVLSGLGLLGFAGGFKSWRYRADRTCPTCKIRMAMVPDDEDDVHWDEGQKTEEMLGSIDYQFHHCTQCEFTKVITVKKWFSGYSDCGSCGYRAKTTSSRTIRSPTYSSSGTEEITTNCKHCGANTRHTRTIPRLQRSSSSSSGGGGSFGGGGGGGGSFGGGSSGGGGSGSSW